MPYHVQLRRDLRREGSKRRFVASHLSSGSDAEGSGRNQARAGNVKERVMDGLPQGVSPTRPDVRRLRLSACRPCSIQMTPVRDGRDHEGHDEPHRRGYGLRREDAPPGPVDRVTARCSNAVSASRQRPYQTQAVQAATAPASSNADSVKALSPSERFFVHRPIVPVLAPHNRPNPVTSAACTTRGGPAGQRVTPGRSRDPGFVPQHSGVAAWTARIGRPWWRSCLPDWPAPP